MKSNVNVAQDAVSKFGGVNTGVLKGSNVSIGASNISSIKAGAKLSKELLLDLSDLATCIKAQADKFTDLAAIIQARDTQDRSRFSGGK
ncbi:MAG: hypothetical protein LBS33_01775 [Streptococcaceae bacterium]|jgi:hypothetical protein|nr:hypothetical protein [Streptococcaceae bacterium]